MQTVTYKHLIDLFAAQTPVTLSSSALSSEDAATFNRYVNRTLRRGWEWYFWPALMGYGQRYYRAAYDNSTAYAAGDQVYYATDGLYYEASQATTGNLPTDTDYWAEITGNLDAYVAYEQAGETAFNQVYEIWSADYRTTTPAYRLKWEYDERGVRILNPTVPASVWVRWLTRPYTWRGADFDAMATYAAGDIIYYASGTGAYEGDFWTCVTATDAGDTPASAAAKWSLNPIPAFLADFAVAMASLGYREGQTKLDAALLAGQGGAWAHLYDEKAKLSRGQVRTASVANLV